MIKIESNDFIQSLYKQNLSNEVGLESSRNSQLMYM